MLSNNHRQLCLLVNRVIANCICRPMAMSVRIAYRPKTSPHSTASNRSAYGGVKSSAPHHRHLYRPRSCFRKLWYIGLHTMHDAWP